MACTLQGGPQIWSMGRDPEGHRTYRIRHLVHCDVSDGPANVLQTTGLPQPGDTWNFGSDTDDWAWCQLDADVDMAPDESPTLPVQYYHVTQVFSTKSLDQDRGNNIGQDPGFGGGNNLGPTDPITEYPKVSGTISRYTEEATADRFGRPIRTSSHEQIRGPQNEWDASRPTIRIEYNTPFLDLALLTSMKDSVNDVDLWGLPPRTIKLTNYTWDRKFHGVIRVYFTVSLDFEIRFDGWDRDVVDEGTKVLRGHWDRDEASATYKQWIVDTDPETGDEYDSSDPLNFQQFKDWNDENSTVILNGDGRPFKPDAVSTYVDTGFASEGSKKPPTTNTAGISAPTITAALQAGGASIGSFRNYVVTSITSSGESTASNVASATLTATELSVLLTWTGVEGATGYKVYRKVNAANDFLLIATVGSTNAPGKIHIEKYPGANFLLLGIPTAF